jgi:acylphosphatase
MSDLASVQVIVHGYVQGVLFRDFTSRHAQELGVKGYVRNLPGGRAVEVKAEGKLEKLEELIDYLRAGPPRAQVEEVAVSWTEYTGSFSHFGIRY